MAGQSTRKFNSAAKVFAASLLLANAVSAAAQIAPRTGPGTIDPNRIRLRSDNTQVIECPPTVALAAQGQGEWEGSSVDGAFSHVYTEDRGSSQVLYCYYKPGALLTRSVPLGTCTPVSGAEMRKAFVCKK